MGCVCPHLIPPLALEEFKEKELSISQGREPNVRRRESLGTRSLHRDQTTPPLLQEYFTSVLYYTICGHRRRPRSQLHGARYNCLVYYILELYLCQFQNGK